MKIVELCEQVLTESTEEDVSNNVDVENVNEEVLLDGEPSDDELEEFKRLNGIDDIKEDEVKEQPTETRVTSIKVSKPKAEKTQKPVEKEVKQKTGKKEQSTKPRAPKKK